MRSWTIFITIFLSGLAIPVNAQELFLTPTDTPIPPTLTPTCRPTPTLRVVKYGSWCVGGCITATPSPRKEYVRSATPTLIPTLVNKPTSTPTIIRRINSPTDIPALTPTNDVEDNFLLPSPTITPVNEPTTTVNFWQRVKIWWKGVIDNLFNKTNESVAVTQVLTPTALTTPTPVSDTPTPTALPTKKYIPKPTISTKPPSTVTESILRSKFGINSPDLISSILNDNGQLEKYEREFYNLLKGWVEISTTAPEQRIFIPSLNTTKTCKTSAIIDIKNASINVDNAKAKMSSSLKIKGEVKTIIKPAYAISLDEEIQKISKDYNLAKDKLNELISKFCR